MITSNLIVAESPAKLSRQSQNLLPYFPPKISPPIKIQIDVGLEGTEAPPWMRLGPFHAHTTCTPQLPEPHILFFSGGQDGYGRHLGAYQAHTTRTPQLPGPHIFLHFWQAGCRWEALGRRAGCAQSATGRILTHFLQICIKIYVNEPRRRIPGVPFCWLFSSSAGANRAPTDFC